MRQSNHRENIVRERIVVVEDDMFVLAFVTSVLRGADYEVIPARDGRTAITAFDVLKGHVDLVLLDFKLPDIDGYHLACELIQRCPDLKIICMSSHSHVRPHFAALGLRFIDTPCVPEHLTATVREYLDS